MQWFSELHTRLSQPHLVTAEMEPERFGKQNIYFVTHLHPLSGRVPKELPKGSWQVVLDLRCEVTDTVTIQRAFATIPEEILIKNLNTFLLHLSTNLTFTSIAQS